MTYYTKNISLSPVERINQSMVRAFGAARMHTQPAREMKLGLSPSCWLGERLEKGRLLYLEIHGLTTPRKFGRTNPKPILIEKIR
ncbi:hypothetical protein AVEN_215966-1 [Araneus ventricosus]|uniref:Uncharacterized protein n=1 Tax=Araneus ventricosus TaxID=182803 RepID=A0A4Y2L3J3_ARAVE|nr:hypothetical protein AVEN_215966-1 [Araneus ventricosus]